MIVVLQRVATASVRVDGAVVGAIEGGLLLLVCAVAGDGEADADWTADKIAGLRVFEDADGRTNRDLAAVGGAVLAVPQFTLAAEVAKGRRPAFVRAADPATGAALFDRFAARLAAAGHRVARGVFGATMAVESVNDGPFTLIVDSAVRPGARGASGAC